MTYISTALVGEPVGLLENDDGSWSVSYGPIDLGVIAHGDNACASRSRPPVDMWTTLRVAHKVHRPKNSSSKAEQNGKCVTHVVGQKCYPRSRLHTVSGHLLILAFSLAVLGQQQERQCGSLEHSADPPQAHRSVLGQNVAAEGRAQRKAEVHE